MGTKQKILRVVVWGVLCLSARGMMIETFQGTGFEFVYGTWGPGDISITPTYVQIAGDATEQGGAGTNLSSPIDLSAFASTGYVQIDARLVTGNQADQFNIIFLTDASNLAGYQLSVSPLNDSTFVPVTAWLNSPTWTLGSIDWTNVTQFQIQGDYSSNDTFRMQFANLQVLPEPSTVLIIAMAGCAVVVPYRIRKLMIRRGSGSSASDSERALAVVDESLDF